MPCSVPYANNSSSGATCGSGGSNGSCSGTDSNSGCLYCNPGYFKPLPGMFPSNSCMMVISGGKGWTVPCPVEPVPITNE